VRNGIWGSSVVESGGDHQFTLPDLCRLDVMQATSETLYPASLLRLESAASHFPWTTICKIWQDSFKFFQGLLEGVHFHGRQSVFFPYLHVIGKWMGDSLVGPSSPSSCVVPHEGHFLIREAREGLLILDKSPWFI